MPSITGDAAVARPQSGQMTRLASLAAVLAGCTTTASTEVPTSEIYASLEAETAGDGTTTVNATLFVGNPIGLNFVELAGGDTLRAVSGAQSQPMVERVVLNTVVHRAELAGDAEGQTFEVVFERAIDAGAPSSVATLPAPFAITAAPQTASRAQPITIAWAPAGTTELASWTATGDCIEDESAPIDGDPGSVVIDGGVLKQRMGNAVPDQCTVTIAIRRARPGTLDPHYQGGSIFGVQYRTLTFTSTP